MNDADEKADQVQRLTSVIRAYRRQRLNAKPTPTRTNWCKVSAFVIVGIVVLFIIVGVFGEPNDPSSEVSATAQCPTSEERAYFAALGQIGFDTAEALGYLGDALGRASYVPYDEWQIEMVLALALVGAQADAVWSLPDPPSSVSDIDRDMSAAAAMLDQIVTTMAQGIDRFDLDTIEAATADIEHRLAPKLVEVTDKINAHCS